MVVPCNFHLILRITFRSTIIIIYIFIKIYEHYLFENLSFFIFFLIRILDSRKKNSDLIFLLIYLKYLKKLTKISS